MAASPGAVSAAGEATHFKRLERVRELSPSPFLKSCRDTIYIGWTADRLADFPAGSGSAKIMIGLEWTS